MHRTKKVKTGVYVIAALLVLVYLLPIYVMLNQSFRFMTDLSPRLYLPEKWTLDNYIQAFQKCRSLERYEKLLCLCCGSLYFGNCIRRSCRLRTCTGWRKNLQCTSYCEHLHHDDPEPVLTGSTYSLMVKFHMINQIWALSLQTAATGMASTMFFYTSFIVSIPKDLDEAASIDGAGIFRTFFKIILPQLKPVTVTRLIMIAVGTWNNFAMPTYLLMDATKARSFRS